jgi:ribosomal protein L30E
MAKKKEINEEIKLLKAKVQDGKAVLGTDQVIKGLRDKSLSKVFLASNCPDGTKSDIQHYADLVNVSVVQLDLNNEELGVVCKKEFFISVLGIVGE